MKKLIVALALIAAGCSTPRALPTERIIILHVSTYGDTTIFDTGPIQILYPDSLKRFDKILNSSIDSAQEDKTQDQDDGQK